MSPNLSLQHIQPGRIHKVLAAAGVASRRAVEEMITQGRIAVNGQLAILGQQIDPSTDTVTVDGNHIGLRSDLVHYLLNKPRGVVSTAADPQDRPTVVEMVPKSPRVFPVGRLDTDSEGLLILTNNGALAQRLTHPSYGVAKEYWVHVQKNPSRGALRQLREGVELADGPAQAISVSLPQTSILRIVVSEGRNRLVRRMCEAVGYRVVRLIRTRIGPITDPHLPPGAWRELTVAELRLLEGVSQSSTDSFCEPVDR